MYANETRITGMVIEMRRLTRIAWMTVRTEHGDKQALLAMSNTQDYRSVYDGTDVGDDVVVTGELGYSASGSEVIKVRKVERLWQEE